MDILEGDAVVVYLFIYFKYHEIYYIGREFNVAYSREKQICFVILSSVAANGSMRITRNKIKLHKNYNTHSSVAFCFFFEEHNSFFKDICC